MDGNGRWAQKRLMPRTAGHAKGAAGVRVLVEHAAKLGVKYLTLFAFSTENWRRPVDEVVTLIKLFVSYLEKELASLVNAGVCLKVVGDVAAFPLELQQRIHAAEVATANNKVITLCVAINYGGRWDVVQAVKAWLATKPNLTLTDLTEQALSRFLSTAGMPDVDLLIRTGGEQRISNFLLWQSAYAELYFSKVLWPEFDTKEFDESLTWYSQRARRFGLVSAQIKREAPL